MAHEGNEFQSVVLPADGSSGWAGYLSVRFQSPNTPHEVSARYEGEPPHGDSYHTLRVNGKRFPGYAWGGNFAWEPSSSKYFACSWMQKKWERRTVVIDVVGERYFVLPHYFYNFSVRFPQIKEVKTDGIFESHEERVFIFDGAETWCTFDGGNSALSNPALKGVIPDHF